jgi:hypothetical protein
MVLCASFSKSLVRQFPKEGKVDQLDVEVDDVEPSGVPSSEESERSRQLGQQHVLDHDPGALVTFGSKCRVRCDLEALRSQSARNSVSSAAARRVTGSRRSKAAARSRGRTASSCPA